MVARLTAAVSVVLERLAVAAAVAVERRAVAVERWAVAVPLKPSILWEICCGL